MKDKVMYTLSICSNVIAFIILLYTWIPGLYNVFDTIFSIFVSKKGFALFAIFVVAFLAIISGLYYFKKSSDSKSKIFTAINALFTAAVTVIFGWCSLPYGSLLGECPPWQQLSIKNVGWIILGISIIVTVINVVLSIQFIKKYKPLLK